MKSIIITIILLITSDYTRAIMFASSTNEKLYYIVLIACLVLFNIDNIIEFIVTEKNKYDYNKRLNYKLSIIEKLIDKNIIPKSLYDIDIKSLIEYIIINNDFSRSTICKQYNIEKDIYNQLKHKLDRLGVLTRGIDNKIIINEDIFLYFKLAEKQKLLFESESVLNRYKESTPLFNTIL